MRINTRVASFIKRGLADFLTLCRVLFGLAILFLSIMGEDAYMAVVILALMGTITDVFDGKAARYFIGEGQGGKLGKYDIEVDTFFLLCIIGYFSLSGIVIPKVLGLGWIGLTVATIILTKRNQKTLLLFENASFVGAMVVAAIYDLRLFSTVIIPVLGTLVLVNYKRILYIVFERLPGIYSKNQRN